MPPVEYMRLCGACERECPSWADRCPSCASDRLVRRLVLSPEAAVGVRAPAPVGTRAGGRRAGTGRVRRSTAAKRAPAESPSPA